MSEKANILVDEIVDIVDEHNRVLFQTTKKEAHQKGLLHRSIVAQVIKPSSEFMLIRQAANKQDPGQYFSAVGGHVGAGETEEEALKREALEEVGLKDFRFRYKGKTIFERKTNEKIENHYLIMFEMYSDEPLKLNHEAIGYKPFSSEELKKKLKAHPEQFGSGFFFVLKEFYPKLLDLI